MKNILFSKIPKKITLRYLAKIGAAALFAAAFILLGNYISRNADYEYTETQKTSVIPKEPLSVHSELYRLVLENDELVIYSPDGARSVTNADTNALTEYDIRLLREGICSEKEELYEILESLMS